VTYSCIYTEILNYSHLRPDTSTLNFILILQVYGDGYANKSTNATPLWAAPEVLRCEVQTNKVDVWSYGIVVVEIVNRMWPYVDHVEGAGEDGEG